MTMLLLASDFIACIPSILEMLMLPVVITAPLLLGSKWFPPLGYLAGGLNLAAGALFMTWYSIDLAWQFQFLMFLPFALALLSFFLAIRFSKKKTQLNKETLAP